MLEGRLDFKFLVISRKHEFITSVEDSPLNCGKKVLEHLFMLVLMCVCVCVCICTKENSSFLLFVVHTGMEPLTGLVVR